MRWSWLPGGRGRAAAGGLIVIAVIVFMGLIAAPMLIMGGSSLLFESGTGCSAVAGEEPTASSDARDSIPANYLTLFQETGNKYRVPWVVLAGIGKVESDDGRSSLPGVHTGANAFGAAGPMQIGIGGASGNEWGGLPIHPASEIVNGVATDADGRDVADVYDPADAIAGAAKYLLEHGVQQNVPGAIFAYNHSNAYVQLVLSYASTYAAGGYTVSPVTVANVPSCIPGVNTAADTEQAPNATVAAAINYAEAQLGKPYQWGATGPDAYDCSGLVMMAYRAAGVFIPRTSQQQFVWGPQVPASQVQPGDLVFFAGADGTAQAPGHVGLVIGHDEMIEAYATGFPIRVSVFGTAAAPPGDEVPVGFTRPWAHSGAELAAG
jgi:peptidoglycan DL-endopeptidase CwlO